ncbi:MAG: DUF3027 domain-containing protein [Pseudoscardovia radai]|nr:DUF3027 domain-containing protein [Pseudoscardovia radai]
MTDFTEASSNGSFADPVFSDGTGNGLGGEERRDALTEATGATAEDAVDDAAQDAAENTQEIAPGEPEVKTTEGTTVEGTPTGETVAEETDTEETVTEEIPEVGAAAEVTTAGVCADGEGSSQTEWPVSVAEPENAAEPESAVGAGTGNEDGNAAGSSVEDGNAPSGETEAGDEEQGALEQATDEPGANAQDANEQDSEESYPRIDPKELALNVAFLVAEDETQVGNFVGATDIGDGVTDFRFQAAVPGYEHWEWSITLFHDTDRDVWTVCESSLVPVEGALLAPEWVPWKDRLEPSDLSPTDSIGTEENDPRLEDGFRKAETRAETSQQKADDEKRHELEQADPEKAAEAEEEREEHDEAEDIVDDFELDRRRVLSPLGRSQAAGRWYEGPHGPKALSTRTANGKVCETCGFFVPIKGDLGRLFGVCANKWSPDDGRVVSRDHGCGEHSEITPPSPTPMWIQTEPALDDNTIEIVRQSRREERAEVEMMENINSEDDADEKDIDENAVPDTDDDASDTDSDQSHPTSVEYEESLDVSLDEKPDDSAESDGSEDSDESDDAGETAESTEPESAEPDDAGNADGPESAAVVAPAEPAEADGGFATDGTASDGASADETAAGNVVQDGGIVEETAPEDTTGESAGETAENTIAEEPVVEEAATEEAATEETDGTEGSEEPGTASDGI